MTATLRLKKGCDLMPSLKEHLAALKDDQKPIARQPFANLRPRPSITHSSPCHGLE